MRNAPAVDAPLADGRVERAVVMLLHGFAFAVGGVWLAAADGLAARAWPPTFWSVIAAMLGLAWGRHTAIRLLPPTPLRLRWTGQAWRLDDAQLVRVDLQLDAGRWMLLRCRLPQGGSRWVLARAGTAGAVWHGLRVALQAHAGARGPVADEVAQP